MIGKLLSYCSVMVCAVMCAVVCSDVCGVVVNVNVTTHHYHNNDHRTNIERWVTRRWLGDDDIQLGIAKDGRSVWSVVAV